MARGNFAACMAVIYRHEGGFTRNRKDRGNWTGGKVGEGELKGTKYGISAMRYPKLDIERLTKEQATFLYRNDFAAPIAFDHQPAGVDLVCLDVAINSGPPRALAFERTALKTNVNTALALAHAASRAPDQVALIKDMCLLRSGYYRGLPSFKDFGKGWLNRNADIEANAVRMALAAAAVPDDEIAKKLREEEKEAQASAKTNSGSAGASGTGSAGSGYATSQHDAPTIDLSGIDWMLLLKVGLVVALALLAGYFVYRAIVQLRRKAAYANAARQAAQDAAYRKILS